MYDQTPAVIIGGWTESSESTLSYNLDPVTIRPSTTDALNFVKGT